MTRALVGQVRSALAAAGDARRAAGQQGGGSSARCARARPRHLVVTGAWRDLVDEVATRLVGPALLAHRARTGSAG